VSVSFSPGGVRSVEVGKDTVGDGGERVRWRGEVDTEGDGIPYSSVMAGCLQTPWSPLESVPSLLLLEEADFEVYRDGGTEWGEEGRVGGWKGRVGWGDVIVEGRGIIEGDNTGQQILLGELEKEGVGGIVNIVKVIDKGYHGLNTDETYEYSYLGNEVESIMDGLIIDNIYQWKVIYDHIDGSTEDGGGVGGDGVAQSVKVSADEDRSDEL